MAKQFKVLVNTGNAQNNQVLDVTQGQGAKGQPLRIAAKAGAKYQLQELDKNKEAAPEYVKVKRVGKNLHILLENSTEADIIIEDYYEVMPEGYNGVVGQAENGNFYEYTFTDSATNAQQTVTLDAAAIAAGKVSVSFAAPTEGATFNVKAVLQDGAGNATPEASDSAKRDTSNFGPVDPNVDPANADKNISIEITSDLEANGGNAVLNAAELASGKISVKVKLSADAKAGDTLVIEGTGNDAQTITLSAAQVAAKEVVTDFANVPANGTKFVATAQLSDLAKNISNKVEDFAVINTDLPGAPKVVILEDANDNSFISRAELSGAIDVKVTVPTGAVVGDTITVTDGVSAPQNFTLTFTAADGSAPQIVTLDAAAIAAGQVSVSFAAPAEGASINVKAVLKDSSGNATPEATDSAKRDTSNFGPVDPNVDPANADKNISIEITSDLEAGGGNAVLSVAELAAGKISVKVKLSADAKAGDTLVIEGTGNEAQTITLSAAQVAAKEVVTDFAKVPANGTKFVATAQLSDLAKNISNKVEDFAVINTDLPGAPKVVIQEDENDNSFVSLAELKGLVNVKVTAPAGAVVGVFYKTTTAGTVTDALTFRAWDGTANITEGVYTDTTPRGGKAQFSLTSDTVGIAVTAPVVLDLNRDGMLSYGQVTMDVNGDGLMDLTRWAGAQDGVLVWDKFADGLVYNNSQYAFGQYATTYRMDALGFARTATDLEGLADAFDTNQDGKFNAADAKFAQFSVWQDANQDGISGVGEVRSLADLGVTEINLVSDGVVRTPEDGVFEAGQSTATLADGTSMLIADVAFAYSTPSLATASTLSSAKLAADASVAGDASQAESTTAELLPADIVTEFNNKPYMLTDEELAALNPLGQTAQAENANVIEVTLNEAQLIDEAFFVGARPLVEPALVEVTNVEITPEDVAAAIAVCTGAADSSTYSLSNGQSLDLTTVLKDMSVNGIVKGLEQVDMSTDTGANVVSLSLADVLSMPPTDGVYKLILSGAANDKVMLTEGEWTDTGNVVNQDGHNYAVYSGTGDSSAQLLIDQHMLQSHQTS